MTTLEATKMRIKKRDGSLQPFTQNKIKRAVLMAFQNSAPTQNIPPVEELVQDVINDLHAEDGIIDIETVQDAVERHLIRHNWPDVAKHYILYRDERARRRAARRGARPEALSDYIHVAKYGRWTKERGRRETYLETVDRCEQMHVDKFPQFEAEIRKAFVKVREMKVLPSMRSMQFAGEAINQHNARMYNCSFTLVDRPRAFQEIFYLLLAGCGVGYSVQWEHVNQLPAIGMIDETQVIHHTVADSIEGWADAMGELVGSAILGRHVEFDFHLIRPEGAWLNVSGGQAPGHLPLKRTLEDVRKILLGAQGRKLRPIEVSDMICFIAEGVLAGGIRRSSLIGLFSPEDTEMLYAKTPGNFEPKQGGKNNQRQMVNISAVLLRDKVTREQFDRVLELSQSYGEPGFFFSDHADYGTNPCGEIGLNPTHPMTGETGFSFCNLCEQNMARIETFEEFLECCEASAIIGTLQASYTSFPYLGKVTEEIAEYDALLGIGLTGMMDNPALAFDVDYQKAGANEVKRVNELWAEKLDIAPAARATTVKPSGTASLELGCVGSGIHPHHSRRYFRGVTANKNEPPAQEFKRVNPHMVETKPNGDWFLVFPIEAPDDAITLKDVPALEFMEKVFSTYENWVKVGTSENPANRDPQLTHNVSCTVTLQPHETDEVIEAIWANRHRIAAMSFAPLLIEQKFPYAPRDAVVNQADEERWNRYLASYRPIDWDSFREPPPKESPALTPACMGPGGLCEL